MNSIQYQTTQIPISGMHCKSCEVLIESELKKLPGVTHVDVSHTKKYAKVVHTLPLDVSKINKLISQYGYKVETQLNPTITLKTQDVLDLLKAMMIVGLGYVFLKISGISLSPIANVAHPQSLGVVFLIGLTAGLSTCMALIGGLVLSVSAKYSEDPQTASFMQKLTPHLYFNLGRILGFALLGGLIGYAGSFIHLSGKPLGVLTLVLGIYMLMLGIQTLNVFSIFQSFKFTLPKSLTHALKLDSHTQKSYSNFGAVLLGALTFFLPCGFTQAMQVFAISTQSFVLGAGVMSVFALGTTPGLLSLGGLTSAIKGKNSSVLFKVVSLVVIIFAWFNISSSLSLLNFNLNFLSNGTTSQVTEIQNNVQVINMIQNAYGYSPNKFVIKKDIPVKWVITSTTTASCASSIYSQDLGINQLLNKGENIITFTPKKLGIIPFSCSMGMYRGSFQVVD